LGGLFLFETIRNWMLSETISMGDVAYWHIATRGLSFQTSAFGGKADMAAPRIDVA